MRGRGFRSGPAGSHAVEVRRQLGRVVEVADDVLMVRPGSGDHLARPKVARGWGSAKVLDAPVGMASFGW